MTGRLGEPATLGDADGLWDAVRVAQYLKASRSWVYQQSEAGILPSLRIVGLLRFDPSVIKAFARGESGRSGKVIPLTRRGPKIDQG